MFPHLTARLFAAKDAKVIRKGMSMMVSGCGNSAAGVADLICSPCRSSSWLGSGLVIPERSFAVCLGTSAA